MSAYRLLAGDCRAVLPTLAAASVHCVVTSPPYWNLRDYGTAQWEGGDATCDHKERSARNDGGRVNVAGFHGSSANDSDKGALDPFAGSGTVGAVATGNGRAAILIELNPAYCELARQRCGPLLEAPA